MEDIQNHAALWLERFAAACKTNGPPCYAPSLAELLLQRKQS